MCVTGVANAANCRMEQAGIWLNLCNLEYAHQLSLTPTLFNILGQIWLVLATKYLLRLPLAFQQSLLPNS